MSQITRSDNRTVVLYLSCITICLVRAYNAHHQKEAENKIFLFICALKLQYYDYKLRFFLFVLRGATRIFLRVGA